MIGLASDFIQRHRFRYMQRADRQEFCELCELRRAAQARDSRPTYRHSSKTALNSMSEELGLPMSFNSQFNPGDKVIIGGEIEGVIERLIFSRDCNVPLYLVEWWDNGDTRQREFNERDISAPDN